MSVAIVLPGGGARGACEAVALSKLLPALKARGERVSIWRGTSVGAINATVLASLAHLPAHEQAERALGLWERLRKHDVIAPVVGSGGARMLLRLSGTRSVCLASGLRACWTPHRWRETSIAGSTGSRSSAISRRDRSTPCA